MSEHLKRSRLIDACPPSIANDIEVQCICEALDPVWREVMDAINEVLIICNIDGIDYEDLLTVLAQQLHVDAWEERLSIPLKRAVLKNSLQWHTRKGTVDLLQEVCDTFFGPGAAVIQEWFDYKIPFPPNYPVELPDANGWTWHDRYRFRVLVDQDVVDPAAEAIVRQLILAYKPVSRWDEGIIRSFRSDCEVFVGIASLSWKYIPSEPVPAPPVLNQLVPPEAVPTDDITLEVRGENFSLESVIYFDGNQIPTTWLAATRLITTNTINVGEEGTKLVYVRTNMIDSNELPFLVHGAIDPTVLQIIPDNAVENETIDTPRLRIRGVNFVTGDTIIYDMTGNPGDQTGGTVLATTFVNAQNLDATNAFDVGSAGVIAFWIRRGAVNSNVAYMFVLPALALLELIPPAAPANADIRLQCNGRGFYPDSVIVFDGDEIPTDYLGLTAVITTTTFPVGLARTVDVVVRDSRALYGRFIRSAKLGQKMIVSRVGEPAKPPLVPVKK